MNEDFLNELVKFHTTNPYIDVVIVALYVCVGYYLKQNFKFWRWPMEIKVLVVGTLVCVMYVAIALQTGMATGQDWIKWLLSYTFSTTFYEIILKRIPGKKEPAPPADPADGADLRRDPYGPGL